MVCKDNVAGVDVIGVAEISAGLVQINNELVGMVIRVVAMLEVELQLLAAFQPAQIPCFHAVINIHWTVGGIVSVPVSVGVAVNKGIKATAVGVCPVVVGCVGIELRHIIYQAALCLCRENAGTDDCKQHNGSEPCAADAVTFIFESHVWIIQEEEL